jgi:radical SAM protein with 4Fe4S-binding SPASM domain
MINEILAQSSQQYNVLETIYFSQILKSQDTPWLHDTLTKLRQTSYPPNDRIVVVQDCADHYPYTDLPGTAVSLLQKTAVSVDISNFFFLIISGNHNIGHELEQARLMLSTDDLPMQHQHVDIKYQAVTQSKTDTFCALPWMHLYVGPTGDVLPCCHGTQQYPLGNMSEQSIADIMSAPSAVALRTNMLSGVRSKECAYCYRSEDAGEISARQEINLRWPGIKSSAQSAIDNFQPTYLDLRLNNICNLRCRMCSSYFSSSIAQEEAELWGTKINTLKNQGRQTKLSELLSYVPLAERIYFAGGEPLLAPEHWAIVDELVKSGNINLNITYNTNLTTLQFRNINAVDLWSKFSNIKINASIDAEGAVAEYLRWGSDWPVIEQNVDLIKQHCPNVELTITSVVGFINVVSLIDLQRRWHCNDKIDINNFTVDVLTNPDHLSVCVLPEQHKQHVDTLIKQHQDWCIAYGANKLAQQWQQVIDYMWSRDLSHCVIDFKRITQQQDQHRGADFAKSVPEFAYLLDDRRP